MFKKYPFLHAGLFVIVSLSSPLHGDAAGTWPEPDFHASYDDNTSADVSHGFSDPGGFGTEIVPGGVEGGALRIAQDGGHLHYLAAGNVSAEAGTVSFYTRGSAIAGRDGKAWLWAIRGHHYDLGLVVEGGKLFLRCTQFGRREQATFAEIGLPLSVDDPERWHHVTASWDSRRQRAWLALDEESVEGPFTLPRDFGPPLVSYLGGGVEVRLYEGGMLKSGNEFDELQVWMQSRALLDQYQPLGNPEAEKLFKPVVAGLYKRFDTIEGLQYNGGWQVTYTWPTMRGAFAQGRGYIDTENIVSLDKSKGTPVIASRYVYAYDILGDESLLEVAKKTGDFLVEAQAEDGYWLSNYQFGSAALVPIDSRGGHAEPKFQDGVQSQPIALLLALYKLTGKSDYIISAKKAGEFYLRAQNPDGSWSYKYDPKAGVGKTFLGEPQGGEINDYAMNDALNIMVLLYHYTYDMRYLEAAKRAADWLVAANLSGKVHGWAQQYDHTLKPAPARLHEPAAYSSEDTLIASEALVEAYRLSGDERYLVPVREAAAWLKERFPEAEMYKYYDPETGRPIASWEWEIYYLDDPEQYAQANSFPQNPFVINPRPVPDIQGLLDSLEESDDEHEGLTPSQLGMARRALNTQNEAGLWIVENVGGGRHTLGSGFSPSSVRALHMLNFLEACYRQMHLAEPRLSHHGDLLRMAAPDDWYDVPWPGEATQAPAKHEEVKLIDGDFSVIIRTDVDFETEYGERRFDRLGRVTSVRLGEREFLCADGLVDEFGGSGIGTLGWDPLKQPRTFIKIGLGEMEAYHAAKPFYMNAQPHTVLQPFPSEREQGEGWWEARQEAESEDGYGYRYIKRISISAPGSLLIDYSLENTGKKAFTFDQYDHAYLRVQTETVSIDLQADFALRASGTAGAGTGSFSFLPVTEPGLDRLEVLDSGDMSALRIAFRPGPLAVEMALSPAAKRVDCYQNAGQFCPELYFEASVEPGETVRWQRSFRFAGANGTAKSSD